MLPPDPHRFDGADDRVDCERQVPGRRGTPRGGAPMVGQLVRARREARGWTQRELAARAGVSRGYVSNVERGVVPLPRRTTLASLGGALGLRVAQLAQAAGRSERLLEQDPQLQRLVGALVADAEVMAQLDALGELDAVMAGDLAALVAVDLRAVVRARGGGAARIVHPE